VRSTSLPPGVQRDRVPREVAYINELRAGAGDAETSTRPSAVSFITTEHFALQSARAATIAESTGRATMFLASASGGLVALGLVATATGVGTAFYAFGLVLLPTLAFVGLVTFERALQTGLEDYPASPHRTAPRVLLQRGAGTSRVPSECPGHGLHPREPPGARRQVFRSVAGMVGVITAVLAGATASLIAIAASSHPLAAALVSGIGVGLATMVVLMRFQESAFLRAVATPLLADSDSDQAP
jgi:hypothetical protein